jgi:transposase
MNTRVTLSMNEIKRLHVLQQIENKRMTAHQAAQALGLSIRQVRRLIARYRQQGAPGLVHGNRGRQPNNRLAAASRERILELACKKYRDYNDCHFTEELAEKHGLLVSRATVRRIRREAGLGSPRKHRTPRHRSRRERKEQAGMLLQADGSRHDWLEGRGPWLTLIAYIDDATGEVLGASFREEEDAGGYFAGLREICLKQGIPQSIYADRHTIFQSPTKATLEQELQGEVPRTQFGRLLAELGITLIPALSPQAKGRIERLWETLQDRLVKDLRAAGASNAGEANQVLLTYLPKHNRRFQVQPAQAGTAYVPWPTEHPAEDYFCFKFSRTVTNDNTLPFDGQRLQIPPGPGQRSYAKARVEVRQHLDGRLEVRYQGQSLAVFLPATQTPLRVGEFIPAEGQTCRRSQPTEQPTPKMPGVPKPHQPAANHPWRRYGMTLKGEPIEWAKSDK